MNRVPRLTATALLLSLITFPAAARAGSLAAERRQRDIESIAAALRWDQPGLWTDGRGLTAGGEALVRALQAAAEEGLPLPPFLHGAQAVPAVQDERAPDAEAALTQAFLATAAALASGRVDPRGASGFWRTAPVPADVPRLAAALAGGTPPASILESLRPRHAQYGRLVEARQRYRELAEGGGWPQVMLPGRRAAKNAAPDERLVARLLAGGDLPAGAAAPAAVAAALARFQSRHGLEPTGRLDAATVAALNVPLAERVRQIELALERWRWLPRDLGARHLLVNLAGFDLFAVEDEQVALRMRVVAGRPESRTPVLESEVSHVIFRPYWNVPPGIAANELVPLARKRPRSLLARNFELRDGERRLDLRTARRRRFEGVQLRQRPGGGNALGLVKFLFANSYSVYLHDTPQKALFARALRAKSHGCVRVEKPAELARFLLGGDWDEAAVRAAMARGGERHVPLAEPVPVHLIYQTVWVEDDGTVRFLPDVYGHDAAHRALLDEQEPEEVVEEARLVG